MGTLKRFPGIRLKKTAGSRPRVRASRKKNNVVSFDLEALKEVTGQVHKKRAEKAVPRIRDLARGFMAGKKINFDVRLDSGELRAWLVREVPAATVIKVSEDLVRFKAPPMERLPKLPEGYGFKGGAARLALRAVLGEATKGLCPRDLDVVRFGPGREGGDRAIAEAFMAEDFRYGHGVEAVASIEEYFRTRDIVINEVVLVNAEVICSRRALADTLHGIIRPCEHVCEDGCPASGTVMKMIRFFAEAQAAGRKCELCGIQQGIKVEPFHVRLHLERALVSDRKVAEIFISEAVRLGIVPKSNGKVPSIEEALVRFLGD